jgi:hypothetical protein
VRNGRSVSLFVKTFETFGESYRENICETFGASCKTVTVEILHKELVVRVMVRLVVRVSSTVGVVLRVLIPIFSTGRH